VQTGSRYLGGYIGSKADRELWVQEKVPFRTSAVTDLAFAALSHPQTAFAGLQKSLQHKWHFIQRLIDDIGDCSFDVEAAIAGIFLPALYGEALPDPSASSEGNYKASTLVCSHILAAFRGTKSFSSADHQSLRKAVTAEIKARRSDKQDSSLLTILADLDCDTRITILQGKETGDRAMAKRHALYTQRH
jgi:hypothetical protein